MTGFPNIKAGLRVAIVIAIAVTAFALPAQALAHGSDCNHTDSHPTAAQYCEINGVNSGGGEEDGASGDSGSSPQSSTQPVSATSSPAAQSGVPETSGSGSLPFTGLDVGALLLVAVLLGGAGLALRRLTASER